MLPLLQEQGAFDRLMDFCAFLWIFLDGILSCGEHLSTNTNDDTRYGEMLRMDIMSCPTMEERKMYQTRMGDEY